MSYRKAVPQWSRDLAVHMRENPTPSEEVMWDLLRERRFDLMKFRRKEPMHGYIADFYCHRAKLVVEVVGEDALDEMRDQLLACRGIRTLRISDELVLSSPMQALEHIRAAAALPLLPRQV